MGEFWTLPAEADEVEMIVDAVIGRDGLPTGLGREAVIASTLKGFTVALSDHGVPASRFMVSVLASAMMQCHREYHDSDEQLLREID